MKKAAALTLLLVIAVLAGSKVQAQVNQALIDSLKKRALQLQQLNNRDLIRRTLKQRMVIQLLFASLQVLKGRHM